MRKLHFISALAMLAIASTLTINCGQKTETPPEGWTKEKWAMLSDRHKKGLKKMEEKRKERKKIWDEMGKLQNETNEIATYKDPKTGMSMMKIATKEEREKIKENRRKIDSLEALYIELKTIKAAK